MLKRINIRLIVSIALSMADEVIILAIVMIALTYFGIDIPFWAVVTLPLMFLAINLMVYLSLRKNPRLGFENKVGQSGFAVDTIKRTGKVRINNEFWFALTKNGLIEAGTEVMVIEQTGLKLTVIKKPDNFRV